MRHFRDQTGVEWEVFLTARRSDAVSRGQFLPEAYREGWLVFECAQEKRRLAPVPENWESLSNEALAELCSKATPQIPRMRTGTEAKTSAPADPLKPKLKEAEQQLDRTLEEVCAAPTDASRLDTGELIRVEETLALAAEAAKEAVSLRRRLKADRSSGASPSPHAPFSKDEPPAPQGRKS